QSGYEFLGVGSWELLATSEDVPYTRLHQATRDRETTPDLVTSCRSVDTSLNNRDAARSGPCRSPSGYASTRPWFIAKTASSRRENTPVLSKMLVRWCFTVFSRMHSASPICLFDSPDATRVMTCSSRWVRR